MLRPGVVGARRIVGRICRTNRRRASGPVPPAWCVGLSATPPGPSRPSSPTPRTLGDRSLPLGLASPMRRRPRSARISRRRPSRRSWAQPPGSRRCHPSSGAPPRRAASRSIRPIPSTRVSSPDGKGSDRAAGLLGAGVGVRAPGATLTPHSPPTRAGPMLQRTAAVRRANPLRRPARWQPASTQLQEWASSTHAKYQRCPSHPRQRSRRRVQRPPPNPRPSRPPPSPPPSPPPRRRPWRSSPWRIVRGSGCGLAASSEPGVRRRRDHGRYARHMYVSRAAKRCGGPGEEPCRPACARGVQLHLGAAPTFRNQEETHESDGSRLDGWLVSRGRHAIRRQTSKRQAGGWQVSRLRPSSGR